MIFIQFIWQEAITRHGRNLITATPNNNDSFNCIAHAFASKGHVSGGWCEISWSGNHIYPTLRRPRTPPSSVPRRSRCGRWEVRPGCFGWGRSERLSHSQTTDKREGRREADFHRHHKDTGWFLRAAWKLTQDLRLLKTNTLLHYTKTHLLYKMLLTTKTNVPRNSARNSLSIPCLIAQCCLMLLLCCISMYPRAKCC